MQPSFAFFNSVVVEEVSLPLWRELFDAIGWPPSIGNKGDSLTHDDILDALHNDPLSDELLQALETIDDLGTPAGRETIAAQLNDRQIPAGVLPQNLGPRELALCLFVAQRSNGALAEVFSRAHVQLQEGHYRRFNDFTGKKPATIRNPQGKLKALEQAILEHCQAEDLGGHVQVRLFDDDEGTCRFQIMRSHHTRTPLAVVPGATSRAKIQYRPVHADLVRYEPGLGRLRITARAASIVEFYRRVFGRVFFGDAEFFGGQVCSLAILQERGRAALKGHGVYGVGRVWMTECIWERGDRERLHIHAADCFETIERLGLPLAEGELVQAKFKMEIVGKSARPLTVTVRVPSRIDVTQARHEFLANEVLTGIGVRDAQATAPELDLWTLFPWRQTIDSWRACFGGATDGLVKQGVLKKMLLQSLEAPGHAGAGRVLLAERVSDTAYVGVSQVEEIPARGLSATDLDGLELDVRRFQAHLRDGLELTGTVTPYSEDSWVLDLGSIEICEHTFRLAFALRQPPADAAAAIRALSQSTTPILLLPRGLTSSTGLTELLLDGPIPDRHRLVQDIIAAANLNDLASAMLLAPEKARLVVDTRLGKVWFDGIEIAGLTPGTHAFRFVETLARTFPGTIDNHDLSAQLSAGRTDGDQTARSAKMAAKKCIQTALKAQGKGFEDPFKPEKGRLRLTVPAFIR